MDIRQWSVDKNQMAGLVARAYSTIRAAVQHIISLIPSSSKAPDDFATRPSIPSWEEYEAASNAQILDRLHKNPAGLLNEQPFIDTLMNVRNAENSRKQTRYLIFGFYVLAFAVVAFALDSSPKPSPPQGQTLEQQQSIQRAVESAQGLLREEFNLKLQSKDMEIKDLKHQISLLSQGQSELGREIKALGRAAAKPAVAPKATPVAPKPAPASPLAKPQAAAKPSKPN